MATRTQSRGSTNTKSRNRSTPPRNSEGEFTSRSSPSRGRSNNRSSSDRSAFSWGDNAGPLIGAALAGVAIGFAANFGRKAIMQGMEAAAGDWDEILASEHEMALAIFDKMLATDASQTFKRKMLLMKLTHALDKHAHEEEMVVYPALREANEAHDADALEGEHGYVKTFLYDLNEMEKGSSDFLPKVREFRSMIEAHMRMEEEQVFPRFKRDLTEEQNARITSLVNKEGFKMA